VNGGDNKVSGKVNAKIEFDANIPEPSVRGKKSNVDWVGTITSFVEQCKRGLQFKAKISFDGIADSTVYFNLRKALKSPDLMDGNGVALKDKVIVYSETHLNGKKRIVKSAYLTLTDAGKKYVGERTAERLKKKS
jgi:hypothetical protein